MKRIFYVDAKHETAHEAASIKQEENPCHVKVLGLGFDTNARFNHIDFSVVVHAPS